MVVVEDMNPCDPTREPTDGRRRPPTILAIVMLVVGTWAVMASSPPSSWAEESGAITLSFDRPAARLAIASEGGPEQRSPDLDVRWVTTSETGVMPKLSVTSLGSEPVTSVGAPVSSIATDGRSLELELTVVNLDETGPVTVEWQATTSVEGDDDDLDIVATAVVGQPSGSVSLPTVRQPFSRLRVPFAVFTVEARYEQSTSATVSITRTDSDQSRVAGVDAIVGAAGIGGAIVSMGTGTTVVPTDSAECNGDLCVLTVTLAVSEQPMLTVEVDGSDASVTAVASSPVSEITWMTLPPLTLLSEVTDLGIDVEMPDGSTNPFADRAVLVARISDGRDPILSDVNCFAPVEFALAGGEFSEVVSFVSDQIGGRSLTLTPGATTAIDLRLGAIDPGRHCDVDADNETILEIGVMTIGIDEVLPASVRSA